VAMVHGTWSARLSPEAAGCVRSPQMRALPIAARADAKAAAGVAGHKQGHTVRLGLGPRERRQADG